MLSVPDHHRGLRHDQSSRNRTLHFHPDVHPVYERTIVGYPCTHKDLTVLVHGRIDGDNPARHTAVSVHERGHCDIHPRRYIGIFGFQYHEIHIECAVIHKSAERIRTCHVVLPVGDIGHDPCERSLQYGVSEHIFRLTQGICRSIVSGTRPGNGQNAGRDSGRIPGRITESGDVVIQVKLRFRERDTRGFKGQCLLPAVLSSEDFPFRDPLPVPYVDLRNDPCRPERQPAPLRCRQFSVGKQLPLEVRLFKADHFHFVDLWGILEHFISVSGPLILPAGHSKHRQKHLQYESFRCHSHFIRLIQ